MAILAVVEVDDQGTLKVKNFRDTLTDLNETAKETQQTFAQGQAPARQQVDALTSLTLGARQAAAEVRKNSEGFGVLFDQLRVGTTVTQAQSAALTQLGANVSTNQKFASAFGSTMTNLVNSLQTGTQVTLQQQAALGTLGASYAALNQHGVRSVSMLEQFKGAALAVSIVLGALSVNMFGLLKESGELAARIETLDVIIGVMGKNSRTSSIEMLGQAEAVKRLGITTREAKEAVINFAQANLDVADAAKIARAAQDLAVIAGENSSATFERLTRAIQLQQPLLLRQVGIVTGLRQIYTEYAETVGKTWRELDTLERRQAFVNKILQEAGEVAGAYEASMSTAGKQIGSFARFSEEAKVKLGDALLPAMLTGVQVATQLLKVWIALPEPMQHLVTALAAGATAVATFAAAIAAANFLGIAGVLGTLVTNFRLFIIGLQASMPVVLAATSAFGGLNLSLGALGIALGAAAAAYIYFTAQQAAAVENVDELAAKQQAQVIAIENARKRFFDAAESVQKYQAEIHKLEGTANKTRAEQERLSLANERVESSKRKLSAATQELIKLAPAIQDAISKEGISLGALNAVIDANIDKRREELGILVKVQEGRLADARIALATAEGNQEASRKRLALIEGELKGLKASGVAAAEATAAYAKAGVTTRDFAGQVANLEDQVKKQGEAFASSVDATGKARTAVEGLEASLEGMRQAADPAYAAFRRIEGTAKDIAKAREEFEQMGTTMETAFKNAGKAVSDLYKEGVSPAKVRAILSEVKEAWEEHEKDLAKENERMKELFKSTLESVTGDSRKLATQLAAVEQALSGVGEGTDDYVSRMLRAKDILEKTNTLTDEQKKKLDAVVEGALNLKRAELVQTLEKWRDKAREVGDAFKILADEGVAKFAEDMRKQILDADRAIIDERQSLSDRLLDIERDLTDRAVTSRKTEVEQKIAQNDRYYQDLLRQLDRQADALDRQTLLETQAIRERANAAERELVEQKRRAMERFEVEVSTDTAIAEAKKRLKDAGGKTIEQLRAEIMGVRRELETNLDQIVGSGSKAIREIERVSLDAADTRAAIRQEEIDDIRETQDRVVEVHKETTQQIIRETAFANRALLTFYATLTQGITQNFAEALLMTKSWKDAVIDIFRSLQRALLAIVDQIVQSWIAGLASMITGVGGGPSGPSLKSLLGLAAGGRSAVPGLANSAINVGGGLAGGFAGAGAAAAVPGLANSTIGLGPFAGMGATGGGGGLGGAAAALMTNPWTIAIGSALIAGIAIYKQMANETEAARERFAQTFGFSNLGALYKELQTLGEKGQELAHRGLNVIGKDDRDANRLWMREVRVFLEEIERSKAFEALAASAGKSVGEMRKQLQLVGVDFDKLVEAERKAADESRSAFQGRKSQTDAINAAIEKTNKLLEEQKKRLEGLGQAATGLEQMATGFGQRITRELEDVFKQLNDQEKETFEGIIKANREQGFEGTDLQLFARNARLFQGDFRPEIVEQVAEAVKRAQTEFNRMGAVATAVFAGILADTGDIVQAMNAIAPALDILIQAQKDLGLEADGAFGVLLKFRDTITANQDVANSLSGIVNVLHGLSDAGILTQDLFNDMGGSLSDLFKTLEDRGVEAPQILMLMQPSLQALYEAQKKFGFATDEATQKLIDMGVENGIVGDHMQSINRQILDVLLAIADALGAKLPEAYQKAKDESKKAGDEMIKVPKEVRMEWGHTIRTQDDLIASTKAARDAYVEMGDAAVDAGRKAEGAATRAAEGSSPTGMKQLIFRLQEAQREFRLLRAAAEDELFRVETAATRAGGFVPEVAPPVEGPQQVPVEVAIVPTTRTEFKVDGRVLAEVVTEYQAQTTHQQSITP